MIPISISVVATTVAKAREHALREILSSDDIESDYLLINHCSPGYLQRDIFDDPREGSTRPLSLSQWLEVADVTIEEFIPLTVTVHVGWTDD